MRIPQLLTIGMVLGFLFLPMMAVAHEATPDTDPPGTLFRVVLPPEVIPNPMGHIVVERFHYEPGADIAIESTEEWVRGRMQFVELGSLSVTPIVDAFVWRGDAVIDGEPEIAVAGIETMVNAGDVVLFPAIRQSDTEGLGDYRLVNPGPEQVSTLGFHMHEPDAEPYSGLPSGILKQESANIGTEAGLQPFADQGGIAEMTSILLMPGEDVGPPESSVVTAYLMVSGTGRYEMRDANSTPTTELRWREGTMNSITPYEGVDQMIVNRGDESIEVLEIAFLVE